MSRSAEGINRFGIERLQVRNRLSKPRFELIDRRLGVLDTRRFGAGEPRSAAARVIADHLYLPGEIEHVGREPRVQKHGEIDLLCGGKSLRLVAQSRKCIEAELKYGKRCAGHAKGHGAASGSCLGT